MRKIPGISHSPRKKNTDAPITQIMAKDNGEIAREEESQASSSSSSEGASTQPAYDEDGGK